MKKLENKMMGILQSNEGRIGYVIAWLLGVPASVLFAVFLIRGH